jgi:hypothetical protein
LKLNAELSFVYETEQEAEAVVKAVSPDNVEVPEGLNVTTVREGCSMLANVHCERSLETFIATLDDLLACISVAEKTFETVKTTKS